MADEAQVTEATPVDAPSENTVSVATAQASVGTEASAETPVEALTPEQDTEQAKAELKDLLTEIVKDIHDDKVTQEFADKLRTDLVTAKQDFLSAVKQVELALDKVLRQSSK